MRSTTLRAAAILVVVSMMAIPLSEGVPALGRAAEKRLGVTILYSDEEPTRQDAAYPRLAADETVLLLRDVVGLQHVEVIGARGAERFLEAVSGASTPVLVIISHGDTAGLDVGGARISWDHLRGALARSQARDVFLASCGSASMGTVEGKNVRGLFEEEVDFRVVAPTVANRLVHDLLPQNELEFRSRFLDYLGGEEGLKSYALLFLFPQETLQSECTRRLNDWYAGRITSGRSSGCIYSMYDQSHDCYSSRDKQTNVCKKIGPGDQDRWSMGKPSAKGSIFPGCNSGPAECLRNLLKFDVSFGGGNSASVTYGIPIGTDCIKIITAKDIASGGTTKLLRSIINQLAGSRTIGKESTDADIGVKLCGRFGKPVTMASGQRVSYQASGQLDILASAWAFIEWDVSVFGFNVSIQLGIEGGFKYPFRVQMTGNLERCSSQSAGFSVTTTIDGGPLQGYVTAVAAYKEIGFSHSFGFTFSVSLGISRSCGNSSPALSFPEHFEDPPLGALRTHLLDNGKAVIQDAPSTWREEDGTSTVVISALGTLVPGTAEYNGLREAGVLAALGVPEPLPAGQVVLLDLTEPRVLRALGYEPGPALTPRLSLVDGVQLAPAGYLPPAAEAFCGAPAGPYPDLEDAECARALLGQSQISDIACVDPSRVADAGLTDDGGVRTVHGVMTPCTPDTIETTEPIAASAESTACGPTEEFDGCPTVSLVAGQGGLATQNRLLAQIHNTMLILRRPLEATILLDKCTMAVPPPSNVPAEVCMENAYYAEQQLLIGLEVVQQEYILGQSLLAEYTSSPALTRIVVPKNYCEPPVEWLVHIYISPAAGHMLSPSQDGNLAGDCDGSGLNLGNLGTPCAGFEDPNDPLTFFVGLCDSDIQLPVADWDGHNEWALGGAWLLVNSGPGIPGSGGTLDCFGAEGHHTEFGSYAVDDNVLGAGVSFTLAADRVDAASEASGGIIPPNPCGDFEIDESIDCIGACTVTFGAGLDGAYVAFVEGTAGQVFEGTTYPPPTCSDGIDNNGDGATDWPEDPNCGTPLDDESS